MTAEDFDYEVIYLFLGRLLGVANHKKRNYMVKETLQYFLNIYIKSWCWL